MHRIAVLAFAVLLTALPAFSQVTYPDKPITLIVPYAPGRGSDYLGRTLAEGLRTRLNETVVVQNVGGVGSMVGPMQVAKAKPDGYTLLINHLGLSTVPTLCKKLNLDPLPSLETIGLFAEAPMVILARKEFAPRDFKDLVAYAKAHREKLTVASAGMGSVTHLCAMLFQQEIGVPLAVVQYKGAAPAVVDVRSGEVDLICDLPTSTYETVRCWQAAGRASSPKARCVTYAREPWYVDLLLRAVVIGRTHSTTPDNARSPSRSARVRLQR